MRSEGPPLTDLETMLWVGDIPDYWAAIQPDKPAIIVPEADRVISYMRLQQDADRFVELMIERGVKAGDRIAYYGRNSDLYFAALFGAIRGGFVLLPLNWRCAPPEIGFMLRDAGVVLTVVDQEFEAPLKQATAGQAVLSPMQALLTEGEGSLRHGLETAPKTSTRAAHDPDQVCLQLYTSGTTGQPKGVLCTHGGLSYARHAECVSPDWDGWTDQDVSLSSMPNFHIGGMSWVLIGLIRGMTCVVTADASIPGLLATCETYKVTRTFAVPTVVAAILAHLKDTGQTAPGLKTITYGASVMSEDLLREVIAVIGCDMAQFFGMTEATGTVCFLSSADHDLYRPHLLKSVGRPQYGMAVEIRNEAGEVVGPGVAGEIWLRTPTMMAGYWNLPEATAKAVTDGWYRSGDGGRLDEDGYVYLTDRIRDMIISGGENVYPAQVEEVLRRHPVVQDVAVVGVPDARWGERVVAVIEVRPGQTLVEADLMAFAQANLARYKCPREVVVTAALPRTAMGKIQRVKVREDAAARPEIAPV